MPAPEDAPSNVVHLRPAPDPLTVTLRMQEMYRQSCLEVVAARVDWLAHGVAHWPEALLTREHILAQLHVMAAGVRKMKQDTPAAIGGDVA